MSAPSKKNYTGSEKANSPVKRHRPLWRKTLKWGFISLLMCAFLLSIAALYVWFNRFDLAERYVQRAFKAQGIEAELTIKGFSKQDAFINDVVLTYQSESQPFFSAKRIEANFILEDALEGRMKKLRFVQPKARITFDDKFQIIDGWLPPKSENDSNGFSIPPDGIFVEDGTFELETPYGSPKIDLTAAVRETNKFEATLILAPTSLKYDVWGFDGSARIDLTVNGNEKDIEALVKVETLEGQTSKGEAISIEDATLDLDGLLTVNSQLPIDLDGLNMEYSGSVNGRAGRLLTPPGTLVESRIAWRGDITRDTTLPVRLGSKGQLEIATDEFTFSDPARAKELAATLSLSNALASTPIAQHFGPSVTKTMERLLTGSSFETSANLAFDDVSGSVSLITPLEIKRDKVRLLLNPTESTPLYNWTRAENNLALSLNASLNAPVALTLQNTIIQARTDNGWRLQGIKKFGGLISTKTTWETKSQGEIARLAPFKAQLDYVNNDKQRDLVVKGGVDFEGRVPGGYVQGLKSKGRVDIRLAPQGQRGLSMTYAPSDPVVKLDSFVTDTEWRLDNVVFTLDNGRDVFRLIGNKSVVSAELSDATFIASHKTDGRALDMVVQSVTASGALNAKTQTQNWAFDFTDAILKSDTVPVEGTNVRVPKGQMTVERRSNTLVFDFNSPALDVTVPQGIIKGLSVTVEGTPTEYNVTHKNGVFKLKSADVPNWPVTGNVKFEGNKFFGTARARIPNANNTPVDINYDFADGAGQADIKIESLIFAPGKLQPQNLLPSFAGKLARVEGEVSADLNIIFAEGGVKGSNGILTVSDMSFGTAPGPVTGLNTNIKLTSLFPLQTAGRQTLTLNNFDPGFPLDDGKMEYELVPEGIKLHSASWPMGSGAFVLDPFTWRYGAKENRVVMRLEEIPIKQFLDNYGNGKLQATGNIRGVFPIVVRGINVLVDKGYLEARDGGIIRYNPDEGSAVTYSQEEALDIIRRQDTPKYRSLARDALREFTYRELTASVDGPLDGDVQLGIIFDGANKKVLNGQPFEFDVDVQGELFNILRSFNSNAQIKSQLLKNNLKATD